MVILINIICMVNNKCLKQFKKNLKRLNTLMHKRNNSFKELLEIDLLKKDLSNWFSNQYMLYKSCDKITKTRIKEISFKFNKLGRIKLSESYIIFKVELTDENKNGLCKMPLDIICNGTFTFKDFNIIKEVK